MIDNSTTSVPSNAGLYGSACDTCRRRRVKCNACQPCDRCTKSKLSCTYSSVSTRKSTVAYVRYLEQKIADLQSILQPRLGKQNKTLFQPRGFFRGQFFGTIIPGGDSYAHRIPQTNCNIFYGGCAGLSALRTVSNTDLNRWSGVATERVPSSRDLVEVFDTTTTTLFPTMGVEAQAPSILPSREQVQNLVAVATRSARLRYYECLDPKDFSVKLDRLYAIDSQNYNTNDKTFLTLVYALMALGRRYTPSKEEDELDDSADTLKFKGLGYFRTSYEMLMGNDSHQIDGIRAIIYQVQYLLSISMLSRAYSHVSLGICTALRIGLHVTGQQIRLLFPPYQLFYRQRVFAILNMMDTHLSSLLGLPTILKVKVIERTLSFSGSELYDNEESTSTAAVQCHKINLIIAKILDSRYRVGHKIQQSYLEREEADVYDMIAAREVELGKWHASLPLSLREGPADMCAFQLQTQLILRLWYSLAQITLYHPFLYHLARKAQDPMFTFRGYEYASACVKAAMQAIWVIEATDTHGMLHEECWFYIYMLGYSANILVYFVCSSVHRATIEESTESIVKARRLLRRPAKHSPSARQCYKSLGVVLDALQLA